MSTRWRVAGLIVAAIAFVAALVRQLPGNDLLAGLPIVVQAFIYAVSAFIAVWLYEAIYHVLNRVGRALFPAGPHPRDRP